MPTLICVGGKKISSCFVTMNKQYITCDTTFTRKSAVRLIKFCLASLALLK